MPQENPPIFPISMASILILEMVVNLRQLKLKYFIYNYIDDSNKHIKASLIVAKINKVILLKIL